MQGTGGPEATDLAYRPRLTSLSGPGANRMGFRIRPAPRDPSIAGWWCIGAGRPGVYPVLSGFYITLPVFFCVALRRGIFLVSMVTRGGCFSKEYGRRVVPWALIWVRRVYGSCIHASILPASPTLPEERVHPHHQCIFVPSHM